jgi:uracil-DNA glycosylase
MSVDYTSFKRGLAESGCKRCGLHEGRTRIVVDRGNPDARVMFIGEAPGASEDLEGRAFVGRSGRLLDSMLAEHGFDTEKDALIVNVVKCRPPQNRRPEPEEAEACLPFLRRQIELVKPKWLALLGATALAHALPDRKKFAMSMEAGRFFQDEAYPGITLFVLFHPAYILRDPRKRPLMQSHLKKFVESWRTG